MHVIRTAVDRTVVCMEDGETTCTVDGDAADTAVIWTVDGTAADGVMVYKADRLVADI